MLYSNMQVHTHLCIHTKCQVNLNPLEVLLFTRVLCYWLKNVVSLQGTQLSLWMDKRRIQLHSCRLLVLLLTVKLDLMYSVCWATTRRYLQLKELVIVITMMTDIKKMKKSILTAHLFWHLDQEHMRFGLLLFITWTFLLG